MKRYIVSSNHIAGGKNWDRRRVEVTSEPNGIVSVIGFFLLIPLMLPLFLIFYPIVGCFGPSMDRSMRSSEERHNREVQERSNRERELDRSWMTDSQFRSKY
jgi:hypothetical protein